MAVASQSGGLGSDLRNDMGTRDLCNRLPGSFAILPLSSSTVILSAEKDLLFFAGSGNQQILRCAQDDCLGTTA